MKLVLAAGYPPDSRDCGVYSCHNPSAAINVQRAIQEAFELIAAYPEVGRRIRPNLLRFALPRYPYLVY